MCALPIYVHIAVIRSDLEEYVLRAIPLVKQFFHEVLLTTQSETHRTLVPFVAGVADYLDLHLVIPILEAESYRPTRQMKSARKVPPDYRANASSHRSEEHT